MVYTKLTHQRIKTITDELINQCQNAGLDPPGWPICVRKACRVADISHTTFYRWMRIYRKIKRKRKPDPTQRMLITFGKAVENAMHTRNTARRRRSIINLDKLSTIRPPKPSRVNTPEKTDEHSATTHWEKLTDQLTSGIRLTKFDIPKTIENTNTQKIG